MKDNQVQAITLAEISAALFVALLAILILMVHIVDAAGFAIDPAAMFILLSVAMVGVALWAWQSRYYRHVRLCRSGFAGFMLVVAGLCAYFLYMAWPHLLPLTQSGDMVNHLNLINFIGQRHSLVHDPLMENYLQEQVNYSPGSHILAALGASWLGTAEVQVLHPLASVVVAIKAGILYNTIFRLLPRHNPALAVGGTMLLLLPYAYFLRSFTAEYFYPMVVSEMFAVAMLWTLVVWNGYSYRSLLAFFALSGIGVLLTWPLWLPIPVLAMAALVTLRRDIALPQKARALALSLGPVIVVAAATSLAHIPGAAVVQTEGSIHRPSIDVYGRPFLALVFLGIIFSFCNRATLTVLLFMGAAIAEAVALFINAAYSHSTSLYLAYKIFYILLYPMTILAALALGILWHGAERWLPTAIKAHWTRMAIILPLLVIALAVRRDLPSQPGTAITQPVYSAGLWAKAHLPNGCIDYLVDYWVTAYWLHVGVLGNPRSSARTEAITSNIDNHTSAPGHWDNPNSLPYAIVDELPAVPPDLAPTFKVLYQTGKVAVVQRAPESSSGCRSSETPIERVPLAPRGWTLAGMLASLVSSSR